MPIQRPNFLVIVTDQHRADYLGCYGHPLVSTPHIDAIAARGTRFDRFYAANPVCMPNRASIMTGRMPSAHGVRCNGIPLSLRASTFADLLRSHGWRTALVGKAHLQNIESIGPLLKPPAPPPGAAPLPDGFGEAEKPAAAGRYDQEQISLWREDPAREMTLPYYGFETVDLLCGHGDEVTGHYERWARARGCDPARLSGAANALPHDYVCPQAWRTAVPEEAYPTTFVAEKATERLRSYAEGNSPFLLFASFPDPHHPFTPPGRYWSMYRPQDMRLPRSFASERPSEAVSWVWQRRASGQANLAGHAAMAIDEREAREAIALTCGMITMIDDAVGRILAELARLGLAGNTVVVFTADHGDLLGEHRMMLKGPLHFQSLIRVPFIWADGAQFGAPRASDALASSIDLPRTVLARAGLAPYLGMQGQDLLPALRGQAFAPRESLLIESVDQRSYFDLPAPVRMRTLVTPRWRMSLAQDRPWNELYDLAEDPDELVNRWADPGARAVRAELAERLALEQMRLASASPHPLRQA
ncbi:MAG: sulfatase family protein [Betaproteobacteria bacterium]